MREKAHERYGGGNRESNFELLRILCIIGILMMHTFSSVYSTVSGFNLVYGTFINSICNTGVSMFVLISGYFGIKTNIRKIVSIEMVTVFYALLSLVAQYFVGQTISIKDIFYSCFPVSSKMYWYITAYMLMMIFADYINLLPEKLDKKRFQRLILIMLLVFSVLPSILQIHVMNDSGKGVLNMLLIYLIGRYIRKYDLEVKDEFKPVGIAILLLGIEFALNYSLSMLKGGVGVYAPFARDCSIFIVALSVLIFLLVKKVHVSSSLINILAKNVIGVYLLEGAIRQIIGIWLDINAYVDCWYLFVIITIISLINFTICSLIEMLRRNTIAHIEAPVAKFFAVLIKQAEDRVLRKVDGYKTNC